MLEPVLFYADNRTNTPFSNPFSPHQIGKYPIADATTKDQEVQNTPLMLTLCPLFLMFLFRPSVVF